MMVKIGPGAEYMMLRTQVIYTTLYRVDCCSIMVLGDFYMTSLGAAGPPKQVNPDSASELFASIQGFQISPKNGFLHQDNG